MEQAKEFNTQTLAQVHAIQAQVQMPHNTMGMEKGQTNKQPDKARPLDAPYCPAELAVKVVEAAEDYQSLVRQLQAIESQIDTLKRQHAALTAQRHAAAGFLGVVYGVYPHLSRVPGILAG